MVALRNYWTTAWTSSHNSIVYWYNLLCVILNVTATVAIAGRLAELSSLYIKCSLCIHTGCNVLQDWQWSNAWHQVDANRSKFYSTYRFWRMCAVYAKQVIEQYARMHTLKTAWKTDDFNDESCIVSIYTVLWNVMYIFFLAECVCRWVKEGWFH